MCWMVWQGAPVKSLFQLTAQSQQHSPVIFTGRNQLESNLSLSRSIHCAGLASPWKQQMRLP